MFENYSYKTKFRALLLLVVMLSVAAYRRSFSTLFEAMRENSALTQKAQAVKGKTVTLDALNNEIATLDHLIGKEGVSKEKVQQGIVSFVAKNSPQVSIYNLEGIHEHSSADFDIYTNQLDLTGNFNNLSALGYRFETDFDLAKVISLDYFLEKKNSKADVLHLKIIFQNYESK